MTFLATLMEISVAEKRMKASPRVEAELPDSLASELDNDDDDEDHDMTCSSKCIHRTSR
jgi:hypothetical protein